MASPIFLSKPHSGFSLDAFKLGLTLAAWSAYRLLSQLSEFYNAEWRTLRRVAVLTIGTRVVVTCLHHMFVATALVAPTLLVPVLDSIELLLSCHFLSRYAYPAFTTAFWTAFHSHFSGSNIQQEPNHVPGPDLLSSLLTALQTPSALLAVIVIIYEALVASASRTGQDALAQASQTLITFGLLSLWTSRVTPALGSAAALVVALALTAFLGPLANLALLLRLWQLQFLLDYLLLPYVSSAHFSPPEYSMWLKVRGGVVCGFCTVLCALLCFDAPRLVSPLLLYILGPLCANLMSRIADPIPHNIIYGTRTYSRWCARQILWIERRHCSQTHASVTA